MVSRHTIAQCITTFKRPYALLLDPQGHIEEYATISHHGEPLISDELSPGDLRLDLELFSIIHSIHTFSSDLTRWYDHGHTPLGLDVFDLQKHGCLLIYRLFNWYQQGVECESAGRTSTQPIDQAICLAHLIYLVHALEPHTQSFGLRLSKPVIKLRQALQRVPLLQWRTAPDVFLWTLTMGALGAKGLPRSQLSSASEFSFFVQYARLSFASDGTTSANDLFQRFRQRPWIPSVFETRTRRLWALMRLCKADVVEVEDESGEEGDGLVDVDGEHAVGQSTAARFFPALKSVANRSS